MSDITTNRTEGGPVGATIFRRVVGAAAVLAVVGVGLLPSAVLLGLLLGVGAR